LGYLVGQTGARGAGEKLERRTGDDYTSFLRAGSVGDYAREAGLEQLPVWHKLSGHPAYDAYWQEQALDRLLAKLPEVRVHVMWEQGLWDQEGMYGGSHAWAALEPKDRRNDRNFLVIGPWRHSGANYDGRALGALKFEGDTALQWRRDVLKPFFDQHLRPGAPRADTPPVLVYNAGSNH